MSKDKVTITRTAVTEALVANGIHAADCPKLQDDHPGSVLCKCWVENEYTVAHW